MRDKRICRQRSSWWVGEHKCLVLVAVRHLLNAASQKPQRMPQVDRCLHRGLHGRQSEAGRRRWRLKCDDGLAQAVEGEEEVGVGLQRCNTLTA